jgi:hypothetical protein
MHRLAGTVYPLSHSRLLRMVPPSPQMMMCAVLCMCCLALSGGWVQLGQLFGLMRGSHTLLAAQKVPVATLHLLLRLLQQVAVAAPAAGLQLDAPRAAFYEAVSPVGPSGCTVYAASCRVWQCWCRWQKGCSKQGTGACCSCCYQTPVTRYCQFRVSCCPVGGMSVWTGSSNSSGSSSSFAGAAAAAQ